MIRNFFNESEEIEMDVQIGPQEEVETSVDTDCDGSCCGNPVDTAKMDPNTIPVAKKDNCEGCSEFYVDAADVAKYADLTEKTMLEALNDIIACNEESGIEAGNIVVVMNESTSGYARNLERNGAACMFINEADDVSIDVQVGPNSDEIKVSEDPQEANPVDAVKRQYDSVVVAGQDDKFFVDVEDVQKCADVNCEGVIDTLNGIIACNEDYDINTENLFVVVGENCGYVDIDSLDEAGVNIIAEASKIKSIKKANAIIKKTAKVLKQFFADNSSPVTVGTVSIGGENSKFVDGKGNKILIRIGSAYTETNGGTNASLRVAMDVIKKKNNELLKMLNEEIDEYEYTSARVTYGRLNVINVEFTVKKKDESKD